MSELINNREQRQEILRGLIMELHDGKSVEEVKARFGELIKGISTREIGEMERNLVMNGLPVEEIQRLCDVHAAVFKGSIEDVHAIKKPQETPGHPLNTFLSENRAIERLVEERIRPNLEAFQANDSKNNLDILAEDFKLLWDIDKHYIRKENLVFPYMERYGITAPPKVMWGVDDEIRAMVKQTRKMIANYNHDKNDLVQKANEAVTKLVDMIFKEEAILFPMILDTFTEDDWALIAEESDQLGYSLFQPVTKWEPVRTDSEERNPEDDKIITDEGYIKFDTGIVNHEELTAIINTIPLDIAFVDKEGSVKFFSQGKERIFPRAKAIIGRKVQNCHPPTSVHIVEKVIENLRTGKKESEDFWIKRGDMFVLIRYLAVRNKNGEFLGTLEVTQNIKPLQELTGEKRLLDE